MMFFGGLSGGLYDTKATAKSLKAREQQDAQYEEEAAGGYCDAFCGAPPKDSVERVVVKRSTKFSQFTCDGTLLRHYSQKREQDTIRASHIVAASKSSPVVCLQQVSTIESLLPFSRDVYDEIDWSKCEPCARLDDEFKAQRLAEDRRLDASRYAEERARQEGVVSERKRKRDDVKAFAANALKVAIAGSSSAGGPQMDTADSSTGVAAALSSWLSTISARCTYAQLKALCEANHVSVAGSKGEVILRLGHVKFHGGPGSCPTCHKDRLRFLYDSGTEVAGALELPARVECLPGSANFSEQRRRRCTYAVAYAANTALHAVPLMDTADGILAAIGLLPGAETAGVVPASQSQSGEFADVSAASAIAASPIPSVALGSVRLVQYSDRAIAVFGETWPLKSGLGKLGGKFNARLTENGLVSKGWVFVTAQRAAVEKFLAASGAIQAAEIGAAGNGSALESHLLVDDPVNALHSSAVSQLSSAAGEGEGLEALPTALDHPAAGAPQSPAASQRERPAAAAAVPASQSQSGEFAASQALSPAASQRDVGAAIAASPVPSVALGSVRLVQYSDRAIAVFGETWPLKSGLGKLGGKFNARLTENGLVSKGWVFVTAQRAAVEKFLAASGAMQVAASGGGSSAAAVASVSLPISADIDAEISAAGADSALEAHLPIDDALLALQSSAVSQLSSAAGEGEGLEALPLTSLEALPSALDHPAAGAPQSPAASQRELPTAAAAVQVMNTATQTDDATGVSAADSSAARASASFLVEGRSVNLSTSANGKQLLISGDTFRFLSNWRQLGGQWNPAEKVWALPVGVRGQVEALLVAPPPPRQASSYRGRGRGRRGVY